MRKVVHGQRAGPLTPGERKALDIWLATRLPLVLEAILHDGLSKWSLTRRRDERA